METGCSEERVALSQWRELERYTSLRTTSNVSNPHMFRSCVEAAVSLRVLQYGCAVATKTLLAAIQE